MADWRDDPGWTLLSWNADYWQSEPTAKPPPQAELAGAGADAPGGGAWAAVFVDHRPVAHWFRATAPRPARKRKRRD